ncbi:type II toxin-antitoxin system RelE/ParE family toxin [Candidatus Gracilibacteria bacterium]|nr:type II toxin-antitoxin system RelE/ParE family toxin [Candidatus Gracilibacteria bacterium]
MFSILISRAAQKEFDSIPRPLQKRMKEIILKLENFSKLSGAKKLKGEKTIFRIRSGNYRIIFAVEEQNKVIKITHIRKRDDQTYRNL